MLERIYASQTTGQHRQISFTCKRRTAARSAAASRNHQSRRECISYQLAAFRLDGKLLVAFGASDSHCAFYPMSGSTIAAHEEALKKYETSKGTIRFQPDRPLPNALVRKLVKARIKENKESKMRAQR